MVSPSVGHSASSLSSPQSPPLATTGITFGPSVIISPSSSAKATEPSNPDASAPVSAAGPSNPITIAPTGTVVATSKPTGVPTSSDVAAPGVTVNTAEASKATNSVYDNVNPSSGLPKVISPSGTDTVVNPTEIPNTANAPTAGTTPIRTSGEAGVSQSISEGPGQSAPSQVPTRTVGIASSQTGATVPGASPSDSNPTQTGGPLGSSVPPTSAQGAIATASGPKESPPVAQSLTPTEVPHATQTDSAPGTIYQRPTGTDTATAQTVPPTIVVAPSASQSSVSADFGPTGIPTDLPHIITPPNGVPSAPPNTSLIQIGFLYGLNYQFVLDHPKSQQQIFKYLPIGIADGLDIPRGNVTMQTLRAYDTSKDLGYITTFALSWIPSDQVDLLSLKLKTPSDKIYNNTDPSVTQIMKLINPAMPILSDNNNINGDPTSDSGGSASATSSVISQQGVPIGPGVSNSAPIQPHSVGIAAGVVCGAAAYGAAMFLVARRYRKRKQSHRRSPSMFSSPVMTGSPHDFVAGANTALMSGGRGDADRSISPANGYHHGRDSRGSGRSGSTGRQQISAPVMAENSLGWN